MEGGEGVGVKVGSGVERMNKVVKGGGWTIRGVKGVQSIINKTYSAKIKTIKILPFW